MSHVKQVILVRKDLKMGRGKIGAQVAHASMGALLNMGAFRKTITEDGTVLSHTFTLKLLTDVESQPALEQWLEGSFTKVCLAVNSEEELDNYAALAKLAGVNHYLITDNGLTEFHGVPTKTCLAIGPDYSEIIDKITSNLKLLN